MKNNFTYQGLGTYKRDRVGRFDSLKAKARRGWTFTKKLAAWSLIIFIAGSVGAMFFSSETLTTLPPQIVRAQAPVLDRIADCESGNGTPGSAQHYRNGQVLLKSNTNGTIDIGKYQINLFYWGKKASELGFDLTKEEDNRKMAEWIYQNKGTGDWSASQKCWK